MNKRLRSTIRLLKAVITGAVLNAAIIAYAADQGESLVIRLLPEVTLDTPVVTLAQICEISGPPRQQEALRAVVVGDEKSARSDFTVRSWKISELLAASGYDLNKIVFRGSARCQVKIVRAESSHDPATGSIPSRLAQTDGPASLATHIRRTVGQHLKDLPAETQVKINFNPTPGSLLTLTDPPYTFRIRRARGSNDWLGQLGFNVEVWKDQQVVKRELIPVEVEARAPMVVAARAINSKATLGTQDAERTWQTLQRSDGKFVTDVDSLLGQRAKRMIPAGTVITPDMIEPQPLAKRGQLVTVLCRQGGLELKTTGMAMETGFKDALIRVRNERSKQTYRGRLIRPGVVLVEPRPTATASDARAESEVPRP